MSEKNSLNIKPNFEESIKNAVHLAIIQQITQLHW